MMDIFTPFILEKSWQKALEDELSKPYLIHLAAFLEKEYTHSPVPIYPPKDLIFNAFYQTPFDDVKVVIVGQDPYHGKQQAHGLCFSVPHGISPPPSLQNIFKELEADVGCPKPNHGCLLSWAKQGILLLNATLTVREGDPMSHHRRGWENFTDAVIRSLAEKKEFVIFVLWGKSAQDKCRFLQSPEIEKKHPILTAAHPSPLSAHNGFFGCRHFSTINTLLEKKEKKTISWAI